MLNRSTNSENSCFVPNFETNTSRIILLRYISVSFYWIPSVVSKKFLSFSTLLKDFYFFHIFEFVNSKSSNKFLLQLVF